MVKRISCLLVAFILLLTAVALPAYAATTRESILYFEDGSYKVTTITESSALTRSTKTASKSDRYYNADDELEWLITVTGTFYYNGTTSECTYVDGTTTIVKTNLWTLKSETPASNGGTATYTVVFGRKILGVVVGTETHSVSLTCDKNGNLS